MRRLTELWIENPKRVERTGAGIITVLVLILLFVGALRTRVGGMPFQERLMAFTEAIVRPSPAIPEPVAIEEAVVEEAAPATTPEVAVVERAVIRRQAPEMERAERRTVTRTTRPRLAPGTSVPLTTQAPSAAVVNAPKTGVTGPPARRQVGIPSGVAAPGQISLPPSASPPPLEVAAPPPELDRQPEVAEQVVEELENDQFDGAKIAAWVRANQGPVPEMVLYHMQHQDGDPTANSGINYEGRDIELFLIVREGSDQLRVVMVDGSESYLFIDGSGTLSPTRSRKGRVRRDGGDIVRITSFERNPYDEETEAFFEIVMTWWESVQ